MWACPLGLPSWRSAPHVCPTFQQYTDLALWYGAGKARSPIRQHTSAYVSIRISAYVSIRKARSPMGKLDRRPVARIHTLSSSEVCGDWLAYVSMRQHTSAYVSIRISAYVSIRQHTSAYASRRLARMRERHATDQ
jgi:hypothetical protein